LPNIIVIVLIIEEPEVIIASAATTAATLYFLENHLYDPIDFDGGVETTRDLGLERDVITRARNGDPHQLPRSLGDESVKGDTMKTLVFSQKGERY
jgi:hypothetical protein